MFNGLQIKVMPSHPWPGWQAADINEAEDYIGQKTRGGNGNPLISPTHLRLSGYSKGIISPNHI